MVLVLIRREWIVQGLADDALLIDILLKHAHRDARNVRHLVLVKFVNPGGDQASGGSSILSRPVIS
ncbi:hypothetical protein [Sphingomonas oleivorans]|uniref:hypothetical protein n=1 Tax=Sphingomonas oleivorans TaxID=1735121 RepID=UPI0013FE2B48|nr:hypothetical protein [Sphingomonas oleivorans]